MDNEETVVENSIFLSKVDARNGSDEKVEDETMGVGEKINDKAIGIGLDTDDGAKRGLESLKNDGRVENSPDNNLMEGMQPREEEVVERVMMMVDDPISGDEVLQDIGPTNYKAQKEIEEGEVQHDPSGLAHDEGFSESRESSSYPSGFGQCQNGVHVHREVVVVQVTPDAGIVQVDDTRNEQHNFGVSFHFEDSLNPKIVRENTNEEGIDSHVSETLKEQTEINETRRVCEEGCFFLYDENNGILLEDLVRDKEIGKESKGEKVKGATNECRGCPRRKAMLASSKRIL
ncbi:hypothetical protein PIB30_023704 [Stylosanthes scabra]|uniref:Uncharacterized protein n=1 Tax=Stylosanthes scabra TaxID=79078 RepID=A0ABU6U8H8_9FABA|nr:hypothetical protein [Stylosanthes scabra]